MLLSLLSSRGSLADKYEVVEGRVTLETRGMCNCIIMLDNGTECGHHNIMLISHSIIYCLLWSLPLCPD
jgi:hypothetical protein